MPSRRHRARQFATQALYQWQIGKSTLRTIKEYFIREFNIEQLADYLYFERLLKGIMEKTAEVDNTVRSFLDRKLKELGPVELAILRIGAYELLYCNEIAAKVILNESIELAKEYAATDAYKYINGVLDKLAKQVRAAE